MHLDDERIERLLHGELDTAAAREAEAHAASCGACARLIEGARRDDRWLRDVLAVAVHPAPPLAAADIARRAVEVSWLRRAAVALLALGLAGAAYAAPGSPLPGWVAGATRSITGRAQPQQAQPAPVPAPPAAGIAVVPGLRFTIELAASHAAGSVTVWVTERPDIAMRAVAGAATFTTGADHLVVTSDSAARYEIELPRAAPLIEVRYGTQRLLLARAGSVTAAVRADSAGRYMIPFGAR